MTRESITITRSTRLAGEVEPARVTEYDSTRPEHHVIYLRKLDCSTTRCGEPATMWRRCRCKKLVAACGPHGRDLERQIKEHCA